MIAKVLFWLRVRFVPVSFLARPAANPPPTTQVTWCPICLSLVFPSMAHLHMEMVHGVAGDGHIHDFLVHEASQEGFCMECLVTGSQLQDRIDSEVERLWAK